MDNTSKDRAYIWHPYTQEALSPNNIIIHRGQGTLLYDDKGNSYIDGISSWWVNIHGHSHPYIAEKIAAQAKELEHVIFAGFSHPQSIRLAERLIEIFEHHYAKVFFSDNGSTAVEVGVKIAIQYFYNKGIKRNKIIAFEHAYHGDTFGTMSVGDSRTFHVPFRDYLFEVIRMPLPTAENFSQVLSLFEKHVKNEDVAAFIYEPLVLGSAGMLMYEAEKLESMVHLAQSKGTLCIADEVMTGFGRTGAMFASFHLEVLPDIICLSKGITGGFMPLGVTLCTPEIYEAFYSKDKSTALYHGHSYTANPLACAAANASLDIFEDEATINRIIAITESHRDFLLQIKNYPHIANTRQCGTIAAFDIVMSKEQNSYYHSLRDMLYHECIARKILLRPLGNTLYFMPPYSITEEELTIMYSAVQEIIISLQMKLTNNSSAPYSN